MTGGAGRSCRAIRRETRRIVLIHVAELQIVTIGEEGEVGVGRKQLMLIPNSEIMKASIQGYDQLKADYIKVRTKELFIEGWNFWDGIQKNNVLSDYSAFTKAFTELTHQPVAARKTFWGRKAENKPALEAKDR